MPTNAVIFARALLALDEAGVIGRSECKAAVKIFIRQASEDSLWNLSTHYRSKAAAEIIRKAIADGKIRSRSQYHSFCKKKENQLRHEHMVPGEVVYSLILAIGRPSVLAYARVLRKTGFRATITVAEDKQLLRDSMPGDRNDYRSSDFHLSRYIDKNLHASLEQRPPNGWYGEA